MADPEVSVKETAAKEFLSSLRRQRRQLWDRSQPDKFEDDISYWTNLGRARNEYYGGYYQHHYDEDSPIGPRNPHTFRHGASNFIRPADKAIYPPWLTILCIVVQKTLDKVYKHEDRTRALCIKQQNPLKEAQEGWEEEGQLLTDKTKLLNTKALQVSSIPLASSNGSSYALS
ncbi:hypothetical protein IHE44_0005157 [Lamprotornis superbus]|uniref:Uncharacterized protein n=1 Tax=Lamprotornis superbus TaxID=245042 RepID=A0A835NXS5_9PASS|nr:hypothetical protein IHE44_0005157 [Lamprotornis superbus]